MIVLRRLGRTSSLLQFQFQLQRHRALILPYTTTTTTTTTKVSRKKVAALDETKAESAPPKKPRAPRKKVDAVLDETETAPPKKPRASRKKVEKPPAPVIEESRWRASIIPIGRNVSTSPPSTYLNLLIIVPIVLR